MVRANFDTGSANPWIFSVDAAANEVEKSQAHFFDQKQSTTFHDWQRPENVKIHFGSGTITGRFVRDDVFVGDPKKSQITMENFIFGLATQAPGTGGMFDALIGLAYPQFAHEGVVPFFDVLMQKKYLK